MVWLFVICLLLLLHSPGLGQDNITHSAEYRLRQHNITNSAESVLRQHDITQSAEYRLRQTLFSQYDRMVRPVIHPSDVVNVTFKVDFKALGGVDNKDQVVSTDTAITQIWRNPFLQWDASIVGIKQILVDPKRIWVPDIVLENNADNQVVQAGHLEKFRTFVHVRHDGVNTWVSPATFKSSCDLNVKFFPFDKQKCSMVFRSLTADRSLMDITTTNIESDDPEKELKLASSNGYWNLRSIAIKTNDYIQQDYVQDIQGTQGVQKREFRGVEVSFFIGRKPMFFVLFSLVPCMIIGMLILVSFFIPAESGERIGLCATILLAVSVYLLVVTEQLPEQSDTLPLIGVYYIVIMFQIGLALAATVLVLMAHHATSEPPKFLTYLIVLNRIACCRGKRWMKFSPPSLAKKPGVTEQGDVELGDVKESADEKNQGSSVADHAGAENSETTSHQVDVELAEVKETANKKKQRPSNAMTIVTVNEDAENEEIWKEIARALDRIFFWLFLAMFVLSSIVIYGQAGRLVSFDQF